MGYILQDDLLILATQKTARHLTLDTPHSLTAHGVPLDVGRPKNLTFSTRAFNSTYNPCPFNLFNFVTLASAMTIKHPYQTQPDKAFWKKNVGNHDPLDITEWYSPKYPINNSPIATAGSCFAQHIGKKLKAQGFNFIDMEPAPGPLDEESYHDFGYHMYSARYGNIYSSRQLVQLLERALGKFVPVDKYWIKDDGFVDPFRPTIEPEPYLSQDELNAHQDHHLACVRALFKKTTLFIFTLGLTEAWASKEDGAVFPVAPGVAGGIYTPEKYQLINLSYVDVIKDLEKFMKLARQLNRKMRFMFTVSPVPLMATATTEQVIVASQYSKSVLRAAAGHLANKYALVDYFPSYEIISSHVMRSQFYNPDMRTVSQAGVHHVMTQFFSAHTPPAQRPAFAKKKQPPLHETRPNADVHCDEELLTVFGEQP
ncbi:MAG: GSCFA family protein [Methylococcaceae bacterium]|nr:MAG: GSCFA family protein [Methylococcaceae bacterium]